MQPPKCRLCGVTEWQHVCSGIAAPSKVERMQRPPPTPRWPASKPSVQVAKGEGAEIDRLNAEVRHLKKLLAEAHAKLAMVETKNVTGNSVTINRRGRPKSGKAMTAAERLRRMRAKRKASKSGRQDFEG